MCGSAAKRAPCANEAENSGKRSATAHPQSAGAGRGTPSPAQVHNQPFRRNARYMATQVATITTRVSGYPTGE